MEHLIRNLTLDIHLEKSQRSHARGDEVASLVQSRLLPELEAGFDRISNENTLIELPHFEIDLGTLQADSLETGVQRWMAEQLPKELKRLAEAAIHYSEPASPQAWLFYFLQNGHLPWSAPRWDLAKLEAVLLENFEPEIWPWLLDARHKNLLDIMERLVSGRPQSFRSRLVTLALKERPTWQNIGLKHMNNRSLGENFAIILLLSTILIDARATDEMFEQKLIEVASTYLPSSKIVGRDFEPVIALELFRREWKRRFKTKPPASVSVAALRSFFFENKDKNATWLAQAVSFFNEKEKQTQAKQTQEMPSDSVPADLQNLTPEDAAIPLQHAGQVLLVSLFDEKENQMQAKQTQEMPSDSVPADLQNLTPEDAVIFLQHAGQVLFAPFLPMLFEQLGWQKQGIFKSKKANQSAVQAVSYLATGRKNLTEHELLLGKILCGWPIEQPVPSRFQMKKSQVDECEAMLKSIIRHWGAIGNASPAGLREGYFEREGKLTRSEIGWVLRIEQRSGFDLLLERLPWSIGHIKLPWMQGLLMVEWA